MVTLSPQAIEPETADPEAYVLIRRIVISKYWFCDV